VEGLNRVTLIGNLGQDPELRFTQGGQGLLNLRMACSERFKNREGEAQERTEWVTVVVWGNRGEALSKILKKGEGICVEGRLQTRSWEAKDGSKRNSTEVVASNVVLLGSGKGKSNESKEPYDGPSGDDDIPF